MTGSQRTLPPVALITILLSTFLWGTAFPVGKYALTHSGPLSLAGMRFTLAGCLVLLSSIFLERKEWSGTWNRLFSRKVRWDTIGLIGLLSTCMFYGLFFLGLNKTSGASAAAVDAAGPLISALFAHFTLHQDKLSLRKLLAITVCFCGVLVVIFGGRASGLGNVSAIGCLLILVGLVFNSAGTMLVVRYTGSLNIGQLTGLQMLLGGLGLLGWAYFAEGFRLGDGAISARFLWSVIYLASVSAIAFRLWYGLIRRYKVTSLSAFSFLTGAWGALLSTWFLSEPITVGLIAGLGLIFTGVQIMVRDRGGVTREPVMPQSA